MKQSVLIMALIVINIGACSPIISRMSEESRNWEFIQSVGGIEIGDPEKISIETYRLNVNCNVAGLKTVTVKPTIKNSALVCKNIDVNVVKNNIKISVITAVVEDGKYSSDCPFIYLKDIELGKYKIEYLEPSGKTIALRDIEIVK